MSMLFEDNGLGGRELASGEIPMLQRFLEENPEYHRLVEGRAPPATAAQEEWSARPPSPMTYTRTWLLGMFDKSEAMVGLAGVVADLHAKSVWHIGIFIVATALHGRGTGAQALALLEGWMRASGARWSRLGVVERNARARAFWKKHGYREVAMRRRVKLGRLVHRLHVMAKPLAGGGLEEYYRLVACDRPAAR